MYVSVILKLSCNVKKAGELSESFNKHLSYLKKPKIFKAL